MAARLPGRGRVQHILQLHVVPQRCGCKGLQGPSGTPAGEYVSQQFHQVFVRKGEGVTVRMAGQPRFGQLVVKPSVWTPK